MTLETVLIDRGLVTEDALRRAQQHALETSTSVRDVLMRDGLLTDEQMGWHLADATGLPFVHLSDDMVDEHLAMRIGVDLLRERGAVPLGEFSGEVTVAVADPALAGSARDFQEALGGDVTVHLAVAQETKIRLALDRVFGLANTGPISLCAVIEDPAGVAILYGYLVRAVQVGATCLRFEPTVDDVLVRNEVDGQLRMVARLPARAGHAVAARARLLLDGADAGRVPTQLDGRPVELELSVVPARNGAAVIVQIAAEVESRRRHLSTLLGAESGDCARELALGGPLLLVAGTDAGTRSELARSIAIACGALGAPLVAVLQDGVEAPGDCLVLDATQLEQAGRVGARLLLIDHPDVDAAAVRRLAASVPSIVLVQPAPSAATAIGLCDPALESLARAAVCPRGTLEAPRWT